MPRKQRFKPSRKPKPQNLDASPPETTSVAQSIEDIESSQTARTQRDDSMLPVIEDIDGRRE